MHMFGRPKIPPDFMIDIQHANVGPELLIQKLLHMNGKLQKSWQPGWTSTMYVKEYGGGEQKHLKQLYHMLRIPHVLHHSTKEPWFQSFVWSI